MSKMSKEARIAELKNEVPEWVPLGVVESYEPLTCDICIVKERHSWSQKAFWFARGRRVTCDEFILAEHRCGPHGFEKVSFWELDEHDNITRHWIKERNQGACTIL